MSKKKEPDEKPFYVYRENRGYFYGPAAGPAKEGRPVDWKLNVSKDERSETIT